MRNGRGRRVSVRGADAAVNAGACIAIAVLVSCLPGSGPPLNIHSDDAAPPSAINLSNDGGPIADVDLGEPFAITGLQPSHGPWTGGTRTTITGRGFSSAIKVWVGAVAVDSSSVFANDPNRASIVTPAGNPGPADVRIRNVGSALERTIRAGFTYDALIISPGGGATMGGTRVKLSGSGTHWTNGSTVAIGGQRCTDLIFSDATQLACTTPPGAAGAQDVRVVNPDGTFDEAREAFTYSDSPDGYRGGLYGGTLSGKLTVLAFDTLSGAPLVGGMAVAGSTIATATTGTFDSSGTVQLLSPSLTGKAIVTVAAKCHQPVTFVDVPVDTVTVYLQPVLDPSCAGDPPSSGNGYVRAAGLISGELVWPGGIEFQRGAWKNVPAATGSERQVAYVWTATENPTDVFELPSPASATTPASDGFRGYSYGLIAAPGNQTLYALAGLENRSVTPPRFEPYVMGVVRGVLVQPTSRIVGIEIPMTTLVDHVVTTIPMPPMPTLRGPDRLVSTLAVSVASGAFAILPQGTKTTLLPIASGVSFRGVPALDGTLSGALYDLTAAAVTGITGAVPMSVVRRIETTNANTPVTVGGFLETPTILQPSIGTWIGTHVALQVSGMIDLAIVRLSSGNGLVTWQIIAPGSNLSFDVPNLEQLPGVATLPHGPLKTNVTIVRLTPFDYGQLRYGQLRNSAWNAYAQDEAIGSY